MSTYKKCDRCNASSDTLFEDPGILRWAFSTGSGTTWDGDLCRLCRDMVLGCIKGGYVAETYHAGRLKEAEKLLRDLTQPGRSWTDVEARVRDFLLASKW